MVCRFAAMKPKRVHASATNLERFTFFIFYQLTLFGNGCSTESEKAMFNAWQRWRRLHGCFF